MQEAITVRHTTLSAYSKRLIARTTEHLEKFFRRVTRIEWVVDRVRGKVEVRLQVHARSGLYNARCRAERVSEAIHEAADTVERQRRRRKESLLTKKRRVTPAHLRPPAKKVKRDGDLTPESFGWEAGSH